MSLIRIYTSRSRLPAWLGLFAMLLLFIAPVISKSLAQARGGEMPMMMSHHGEMAMADMPHTMASADPSMSAPHHPMSMMDDSACGYCVLLIHLPLNLSNLPELWTLLQAAALPQPEPEPLFIAIFVPIHYRSRAPPFPTLNR
ncbi:DUF2946 domain-containing protein [Erwiniaceae bacterium BAC15a-03b]|uniref:DUF2946 domain-containing protein n=1 Tax=Winslowiella arboricola TaxID=2978220 RepID=A0A9J6PJ68_9GAMM|nr:DUF2946 domain-containing protein [Winslowiella arboricola]MCU5771936.1 DUF2946 domain-containing protein [Winslowiella arboricola]MCU5778369.1 DUF2946 domain-containing protein [Winslowiella arboricola]